VTDGQTDGETDRQTDRQNYDSQDRASIAASRDKNQTLSHLTGSVIILLVKMAQQTVVDNSSNLKLLLQHIVTTCPLICQQRLRKTNASTDPSDRSEQMGRYMQHTKTVSQHNTK